MFPYKFSLPTSKTMLYIKRVRSLMVSKKIKFIPELTKPQVQIKMFPDQSLIFEYCNKCKVGFHVA